MTRPLALIRRPGPRLADGLVTHVEKQAIDLDLALAELPEEFRVVIVLRDQMGLDYAEIAEVLDIPPGTVRSRIARGRGRLADLLAPVRGTDGNRGTVPDVEGTER